jgi:pimeloyl-ACP methyl ester carboxylesterase
MRPIAVVIPGFLRTIVATRPFGEAVAMRGPDVRLRALPGHHQNEPMLSETSLESLTAHFRAWLEVYEPSRTKVLVGESLGGLIALALARDPPPGLRAVVAADPILKTYGRMDLRLECANPANPAFLIEAYGRGLFGVDSVEDGRDFRGAIGATAIPAHVLAAGGPSSVLDAEDRDQLRGTPGVILHELGPEVGHLVLVDARAQAVDIVARVAEAVT